MPARIQIPENCKDRLRMLLDFAWDILLAQIISKRMSVNKEASLQLHYAATVQQLGAVFCLLPGEVFAIELETSIGGGEVDVTCSLGSEKAAVEMKCFRKSSNRAKDIDMYEVLSDLERVQDLTGFSVKKFLCLADNPYYASSPHRGHASIVSTKHGAVYPSGSIITPSWAGRWKSSAQDAPITFRQDVRFDWTTAHGWYSLNIDM